MRETVAAELTRPLDEAPWRTALQKEMEGMEKSFLLSNVMASMASMVLRPG